MERNDKVENNEVTAVIGIKESQEDRKDENKKHDEKFGGVGEIVGRIFKFIGKIIKKRNKNFLEARKDDEKPIRISITIVVLLLIFLSIPTIALLIFSLFCGYKFSISGPNSSYQAVNDIFEGVSKSADSIKKEFKEEYQK